MAITVDDKARYRTGEAHLTDAVMNVVPMVVVASAQINQSVFTYPLAEITVDNTFGDWTTAKSGQMITIGTTPGASDVTYGVVRKTPTSTKFYMDAKGQGDPGYARDIHQPIGDDMYITIYKYRPPWGLLSSIRNGVFYKQWELPYAGQGANPDPIVYMGEWRQGFVDPVSGLLRLPFEVSAWTWNKSVSSILWDVDGATIAVGDDNDASIEVDFEAGFYEVTCKIVDSKGKFRTGYRYVWANTVDPEDIDAPFSYARDVRIVSDRRDALGRTIAIEVDGALAQDELYPGQAFLVSEYSSFGGETLDDDSYLVKSFVGYSTDLNIRTSYRGKTATLNLSSPTTVSKKIPTASQQITEAVAPKNWTECTALLSNPVGAAWYICAWHSPYLMDAHDLTFDPYLLQLRRKVFQFQQRDIGSQLLSLNPLMNGNIGCRSSGKIRMLRHPFQLQNDDRDLLEEMWTLEPTDILDELTIPVQWRNEVGQTYGFSYSFGGGVEMTPYASLAPGYAQAQGSGQNQMTAFTVIHNADGQQRVNEITGHQFAMDNPRYPNFTVRLDRNLDIFEPCDIDRLTLLSISADYDPLGFGWNSKRCIPIQINTQWSYDKGTTVKTLSAEYQIESYGVPGVTVPVNRGGANNWLFNQWNPGTYDPYEPKFPDMGIDIPFLIAWNSDGKLGRSQNPLAKAITWKRITGFSGKVRDASFNYGSPFFSDPMTALGVWIITDDGLTIRIYYTASFLITTPVWTLQATYTAGSTYKNKARIIGSKLEAGFAIASWKTRKGIFYSRTTNTGTSWSVTPGSLVQVADDPDHDDTTLGMAVYDESQAIVAPTDVISLIDGKYEWGLYLATSKTGSFTLIPNDSVSERVFPDFVALSDATGGWAGTEIPEPPTPSDPLETITFNGSAPDYLHYTVIGAGITDFGVSNPAAYSSVNLAGSSLTLGVEVDVNFDGEDLIFQSATWIPFLSGLTPETNVLGVSYFTRVQAFDADDVEIARYEITSSDGFLSTINADTLGTDEPIRQLWISIALSWISDSGSGIGYVAIDSIDIRGDFVERKSSRKLQLFISPSTWSDRSSNYKHIPIHHYGLSVDASDFSKLAMAGADEDGNVSLLKTNSSGSPWSRIGKTPALGVKRGGNVLLLWGYGNMGISNDLGSTVYSRVGDWPNKVGQLGKVEGMLGVL